MRGYEAVLNERHEQERRLEAAGIQHDGGGVDFTTGRWDIFAYPNDDVYAHVLHSIEDVDNLIATYGRAN